MDYKQTLNLPKTDFPMKADLPNREPDFIKRWQETDLSGKLRKLYKGKEKFILHDGPPYANGNIHMGHALNKILKDIVIRYKTMRGYDAPYVPGWDCHGLPVEHQLFKELKIFLEVKMSELTTSELVKWILAILVIVAVVVGIFFAFKNNIFDYFKNLPVGNNSLTLFMGLLK